MKNDGRNLMLNDHYSWLYCNPGIKKKSVNVFAGLVLYSTLLLKTKLLRMCSTGIEVAGVETEKPQ